jgi:Leucine-rich repeat (LRR) protein
MAKESTKSGVENILSALKKQHEQFRKSNPRIREDDIYSQPNRLGINRLGDETMEEVAKHLESEDAVLEVLNMERNRISDKGIKGFAEALAVNKSLKKLKLSQCILSEQSIKDIADALAVNKTLESLDLSDCKLSDEGIKSIADALALNTGLKKLDISGNNLSDVGAEHIALALYNNKTLKDLYLDRNKWDIKGAELIKTALVFNDSLVYIEMDFSDIFKNLCIDSERLAPKEKRVNDIFDLLQKLYSKYKKFSEEKRPKNLHNAVNKLTTCVNKYKENLEGERRRRFDIIYPDVKHININATYPPKLSENIKLLTAGFLFKNIKNKSSKKSSKKSPKKSSKKSSKKSPKFVKKHF